MQDPPLLTSENTKREDRPEVALMFMTGCYQLTCKTSGVWIGVLGCSALIKLVKSSGVSSMGCERQVLCKETLTLLSLHNFGFIVQRILNSCLISLMFGGFVLQRQRHGT